MRRSCSAPQTAAPPPPARPRAGGPCPPAQRRTRGASPALTRYASCREPHAPPEPGVAPAAFQWPPSLLRQTLSSSTPSSRITCTPQDKTAAPAVTPPSTPARERGREGGNAGDRLATLARRC